MTDSSLAPTQRRIRALMCHGALDLRLEHLDPDTADTAKPLGSTQLRVRVAFGGICGSDLHYYQHGGFGVVRVKQPMALGHEVSGVVEEVGSGIGAFKAGQRIAVSPSRPCGACRFCQLGQQNHCLAMRFYGSAMPFPHIQGAFRDSLVIEQHQAHAVADHLSLSEAALAEPLSVGLHAIQRAGGVFGKQVLVTGCGPIGALLIGGLRQRGAIHQSTASRWGRSLSPKPVCQTHHPRAESHAGRRTAAQPALPLTNSNDPPQHAPGAAQSPGCRETRLECAGTAWHCRKSA